MNIEYAELTFYPITKNLIKMANLLHTSVLNNNKLVFNSNNVVSSSEARFYEKHFNNNWYPWLWSRTSRRKNNTSIGWELYFNEWSNNISLSENKILNLAKCANSIFNLNDYVLNYINKEVENFQFTKHTYSNKKQLIGLHIRRGDQQNISGDIYNNPKYIHINKYIDYIKKFSPIEVDFYISSEDNLNIFNLLKDELPEYNFIINSVCHNIIWSNPTIEGCVDIEGFCTRYPENIENIVMSTLLDLYMLQKSNIFIGPLKHSAYSYIAYLLALGYNHNLKFIDISTDISDITTTQFNYINNIKLI